ncbi:MAG: diversity-generating retroelement protein Avd [Saprospirales bacterium]|nr:diversity-generating retroelement protein Avd [Saprospirales bacterium]
MNKILIKGLRNLPRDQKFLLGDRIQNLAGDVLEQLIEAFYLPKDQKGPILRKVNINLEKLRHFFRLCFELGYINSTQLKHWNDPVQELGRMVGGWLKTLEK